MRRMRRMRVACQMQNNQRLGVWNNLTCTNGARRQGERSGARAERVRAVREARVCGRLPHGASVWRDDGTTRHRLREVHRVRASLAAPSRRAQAQPRIERVGTDVRRRRARALRVLRRAARASVAGEVVFARPGWLRRCAGMRGELLRRARHFGDLTTRRARCRSLSPATRRCCAWTTSPYYRPVDGMPLDVLPSNASFLAEGR